MEEKKISNQDSNLDNMDELLDDDLLSEGEGVVSLQKLRAKKESLSSLNKLLIGLLLFVLILFLLLFGVYKFFDITMKKGVKNELETKYVNLVTGCILSNIFNENNFKLNNNSNLYIYAINLKKYIEDTSSFYYKKEQIIKKIKTKQMDSIKQYNNELKKYQDLIAKYKYLPKEINKILKDVKVMPILLVLDSIKIYVADYVFIQTGDFPDKIFDPIYIRSTFPSEISFLSKDDLEKNVSKDLEYFREEGVSIYLKDMIFNYMNDGNDSFIEGYFINDFYERYKDYIDNRYNYYKNNYGINLNRKKFITDYIRFIGKIYFQTNSLFNSDIRDFLPVDVQLLSYNPKDESLSFNIKVMIPINKKVSIVNIATNIISLLRASRLIIGSQIRFNDLKTTKFTKRLAGQKITYNVVNLTFKTYIQSKVNVEVSDIKKEGY